MIVICNVCRQLIRERIGCGVWLHEIWQTVLALLFHTHYIPSPRNKDEEYHS